VLFEQGTSSPLNVHFFDSLELLQETNKTKMLIKNKLFIKPLFVVVKLPLHVACQIFELKYIRSYV